MQIGQNVTRRKKCRLCGSVNLELVIPIRPSPIADAYVTKDELDQPQEYYPLDLYHCADCSHLQNIDVVNPEILFRNYTYETSSSLGLVNHYEKYANEILDTYAIESNSLVVEIGSNDGSLLQFFKDKQMKVLGVDPAITIAHNASSRGIETLPEFFTSEIAESIRSNYGAAKVVTANNVFAHSDELADIVKGIYSLLDDDGIFIFEVSYLVDIIDNFLFDTVYHEHVSYHAITPLVKFFQSLDMELVDVVKVGSKGGSIRGVVQLARKGARKVQPIIDEMLKDEKNRGMDKSQLYKNYYNEIEERKDKLNKQLDVIIDNGGSLVGYGASTTVTTLCNHFLISDKFKYFVDDNPVKQGKYTPGSHLPVYPSDYIYKDKPDFIVILAWQYADPIIKRHQKFLDGGGKFIIPLPEPRVYE